VWVLFILFAGVVLTLRYAILPNIDHYRPDLERLASDMLHQKVTIGAVSSSWQGFRPRLSLTALQVYDTQGSVALRLPEVDATLSWQSLVLLSPRLHALEVGGPDLEIRRDGPVHLLVGGIPVDLKRDSGGPGFVEWLLGQHQVVVRQARILWRDETRSAPDLTLDNINIVLEQFGTRHRFSITATPDEALASPVDLRGYFDHTLFADESDTTRWGGEVYGAFDRIDLAAWHPYVDYPFEVTRGTGALRAWLHFSPQTERNGRTTRLPDFTADLRLHDLVARSAPSLALLAISSVEGRIEVRETPDGDELTMHEFSIAGPDGLDLPTTNLLARRTFDEKGVISAGSITSDRVDLETLANLLRRVPLSSAARNVLDNLRPRGELKHFTLAWRGTPDAPRTFDLASDLVGLSMASIDVKGDGATAAPGFANLTGHVRATEHDGTLVLASHAAVLSLPGVFDTPLLPLQRLEGEVTWTLSGADLEVHVPTMSFENADASGTAQATYRHGPKSGSTGPGYLDVSAHFSRVDGTRVVAYLPTTIHGDIKRYLVNAILAGSSDDTSIRVRGALERFPFREAPSNASRNAGIHPVATSLLGPSGPEEFRIVAKLHGVRYDYAPRYEGTPGSDPLWPIMTLGNAELIVDRSRMEISASSATVYGYTLSSVHAQLPDLDDHNEVMQIKGEGSGPLQDLLHFVNTSPVGNWIGHLTDNASATGNAKLTLTLAMPFAHIPDTHVAGSLQMQGNELSLFTWLPPLTRATGRLDFSENGVELHEVSGDILGGSLKLSGTTREDHVIEILGEGNLVATSLKHLRDWPTLSRLGERLDGGARYTLGVHVPGRSTDDKNPAVRQPRVVLDSTLAGLAIDLPDPLKKNAADSLPMHLELSAPQGKGRELSDELRLRLGATSAVFLRRPDEKGEMQIAQVAYGVNEAATLSEGHASLNLSLKALDADAWLKTFSSFSLDTAPITAPVTAPIAAPAGPASVALYFPDAVSAHVDALRLWDKQFDNVVVSGQHTAQGWQVNLTSDQIAGRVGWRQGGVTGSQQNRITARLTRLTIPKSAAKDVNTLLQSSPSDIPALDIIADNFELNAKKFGHLELLASNALSGGRHEWRLEKLTLSNPDGTLDAQGSWGAENGAANASARTRLGFTVTSSNVGGLLDRMGVKGTIEKGVATLKGDINWRGSPLTIDYDSLAGTLHMEASKGQFLKADPGVAKLLGVLSLQSLTRRLSFDFTDIFGSGFSFDSIDANVTIVDGIADTHDFTMKGAAASVVIAGSTDLSHETQNLHVTVIPRVNPGAASLLLLANPVTALLTLGASQVLEGPLSNIFRAEYNVTGPWAAPVVGKVERLTPNGAPRSDPTAPVDPRSTPKPSDSATSEPG
jgi:uncharacterized protein (TIGR02099 family)